MKQYVVLYDQDGKQVLLDPDTDEFIFNKGFDKTNDKDRLLIHLIAHKIKKARKNNLDFALHKIEKQLTNSRKS